MPLSDGNLASLVTVLALAIVHVCAGTTSALRHRWQPRALSAASGISVAYIFLDLMPALADGQDLIDRSGLLADLEQHVYIMAVVGLTVAFWVETASRNSRRRRRDAGESDQTGNATFALSIVSFCILNATIGYAVASPGAEVVEPLWIFAVAMGLHFLINDHSLAEHHGARYQRIGRWLLCGGLLTGWIIGTVPSLEIPPAALALVFAYIAGGMIMNILRHELPDTDRSADVAAFAVGAAIYGVIILSLSPLG